MELQLDFQYEIESIIGRDLTRAEIQRINDCVEEEDREDAAMFVSLLGLNNPTSVSVCALDCTCEDCR